MKIVVKVERWMDAEGLEVQEIGRLELRAVGHENETGSYSYVLDEGRHPMGVLPLRDRSNINDYPRRQSVWALVARAIHEAIVRRATQ